MARYAYDVNTQTKHIDVHKQFNGGLKTVDTDDALGAVFLRQAENVSLSEFGFIEKRYGTYKIDKFLEGQDGEIQGYWEYYEADGSRNDITIVGGKLFLRKEGESNFTEITTFRKEGNFKYDDTIFGDGIEDQNFISFVYRNGASYRADNGEEIVNASTFSTTKIKITDIEGFNVLNKLKITGTDKYSYLVFWDDSGDYLGYYGSPLAQDYEVVPGTTIDLSEFKLASRPVRNQTFTIPLDAAYVAIVGSNAQFDVDGTLEYVWGQDGIISFDSFSSLVLIDTIGGTVYPFTIPYYPFQSKKEVSGVLIKDYLYIFNGTYPIYYKGGSSFYVFPMYTPSATDVVNAGHNYLETRDFDEIYGYEGNLYQLNQSDNFLDPSLDFEIEPENSQALPLTPRVSFTQQEWYPKLPFAVKNQQKGELTFELNYNYSKEVSKIFDPYLYGQATSNPGQTESAIYTNKNYAMRLDNISYAGANAASNTEYVKINPEKIDDVGVISNYSQALDINNQNFSQFRVRDEFGLFRNLVTEDALNGVPSQTHGIQQDPSNPLLNGESTQRNFLGKERKHPYGIDELWIDLNVRDLSISIEESITRTPDSGNLAGQLYGLRFKRETGIINGRPSYEKLDFDDILYPFSYPGSVVREGVGIDGYLSRRFAVIIRPITAGYAVENKEYWKLLYNNSDCYFEDQMLYFRMPDFPDRIDNEAVTGYAIDIKTVDYEPNRELGTSKKRTDYIQNYSGKASRSLRCIGQESGIAGLRDLWPGLGATRSKLDYNLFAAVTPQFSEKPFGSAYKATITELIPGTYDFKLTFALDETKVEITQPYEQDEYKGDWNNTDTYNPGDVVRFCTQTITGNICITYVYYRYTSQTAISVNRYPPTSPEFWEIVDFTDYIEKDNISTDTQFISIYFRNIEIFGDKIEDYRDIKENGKSPVLSATRAIEHYGKLLVFGSNELEETVFVSFPENFNYFPKLFKLDFYTEAREPVQAVTPFMNVLVVQTLTRSWGIKGTSPLVTAPDPYSTFMITPSYGTIAPKSVQIVRNQLFFLSHLGVVSIQNLYAIDNQYNVKPQDTVIKNIVGLDPNAVATQFDDQYWLNLPKQRITLRWYIDKKAWVQDIYNWNDFKGVLKYTVDNGQLAFITKKSRFDVNEGGSGFYKIGIDKALPSDLGTTIRSKFETSFLNQNYPFHHKNYKEFKYDFTLQNEYNLSKTNIFETDDLDVNGQTLKTIQLETPLIKNHYYLISFSEELPIDEVRIGNYYVEDLTPIQTPTYVGEVETLKTLDYQFSLPNDFDDSQTQMILYFENGAKYYNGSFVMKDNTYDESIVFLSKIITEENNLLSRESQIGYEDTLQQLNFNAEDYKDFTLGTTSFGNRVTFVKTMKLSGRGYNAKAYFEDFSKSKWTIESMGITYKMRKARSR